MNTIEIAGRKIGKKYPPFIVAEMSCNHNQSLVKALKIVEKAADAGVDAIKLQTYTPDTMTLNINSGDFKINNRDSLWYGQSLYQLYKKGYTPWEWHKPIFEKCKSLGLIYFSTPFDESAVDFLESLEVPAYKIASFENTDIQLIKKIISTGKPIIISTGMATIAEIDETVREIKKVGHNDIILLKTTSSYPALPEDTNIITIPHMKELFDCQVGLSDHTLGIGVAVASIALGATLVEKHLTINRSEGGLDSVFSMIPEEMKLLVSECNKAWQSIGKVYYGTTENEKDSIQYRRSLYITQNINAGEVLTKEHIRSIRPGYGISPKYLDIFLGKKVKKDIQRGTPVNWDIIL